MLSPKVRWTRSTRLSIAENQAAFDAGYEKLTEGCNACHQAANVGQVVIKVPNASTFPDQDFRPKQR